MCALAVREDKIMPMQDFSDLKQKQSFDLDTHRRETHAESQIQLIH